MAEKYDVGDEVEITIKARVTGKDRITADNQLERSGSYLLFEDMGVGYSHALFAASIGRGVEVKVTKRAKPQIENWPPQEGDVWRSVSRNYHYISGSFRSSLGSTKISTYTDTEMLHRTGLRLVYRAF